jgi:hypothetical protein
MEFTGLLVAFIWLLSPELKEKHSSTRSGYLFFFFFFESLPTPTTRPTAKLVPSTISSP